MMDKILAALLAYNFRAYAWSHAPADNYGVVSMDGRNDMASHIERSETGTVDWYSRNPASSVPAVVESTFEALGVSWYFNSLQYEEDTGFLHWEWVWNG
jgi:hypothetical protein